MCLKISLFTLATIIVIAKANLENKVPIDGSNRYYLGWSVDTTNSEVTFEVEVQTGGYVGLGISPSRTMAGADIFIGGVRNGAGYSGDYHATHNAAPLEDAHSDWILLSAVQNATHTVLRFSRKIDTRDAQDNPIVEGTNTLIWAIGPTDNLSRHSYRGTYSANILNPGVPPTGSPPTGSTGTPLPSTTKGTGSHLAISQLILLIALGALLLNIYK